MKSAGNYTCWHKGTEPFENVNKKINVNIFTRPIEMTEIIKKEQSKSVIPIESSPIQSVADYIKYIMNWKHNNIMPTAFRGQSFNKWKIEPKLFRNPFSLYEDEDKAIRDVISLEPEEFRNDITMFDKLVRMQHFGLPTRLLDVTTNPLIALWFATELYECQSNDNEPKMQQQDGRVTAFYVHSQRAKYYDSDTVSCLCHLASLDIDKKNQILELASNQITKREFNRKAVVKYLCYQVGMEKPHFKPLVLPNDLIYPHYVKPKLSNKRIIAQSGAFILYGAIDYDPKATNNRIQAMHLNIPATAKENIRRELEVLGINERTLFPDIERATKFITLRYQNSLRDRENSLL